MSESKFLVLFYIGWCTFLNHNMANAAPNYRRASHLVTEDNATPKTVHKLRPFHTDGCSAPMGLAADSWTDCCGSHDFAYWMCGDDGDKRRADAQLVNCLRQKGLTGEIAAKVIEWAPRRLSDSYWCARWDPPRPSSPLTLDEIDQVKSYEDSFSLKFPVAQRGSERKCSTEELPYRLRDLRGTLCFDLVKVNASDVNKDKLVYSDDCVGYFIVHNQYSVEGFGHCANLVDGIQSQSIPNCPFVPSPLMTYSGIITKMKNFLVSQKVAY